MADAWNEWAIVVEQDRGSIVGWYVVERNADGCAWRTDSEDTAPAMAPLDVGASVKDLLSFLEWVRNRKLLV